MKRTILLCITSAIILFAGALAFNNVITDLFLSFFNNGHLNFVVNAVNSTFMVALKISISFGLIPLLLLILWITGKITLFSKRLLSVLVVTVCIILAIMLNVFRINSHEIVMANLPTQINFPIEELFFEYAIAIGTISGVVISYFTFRKRKGTVN